MLLIEEAIIPPCSSDVEANKSGAWKLTHEILGLSRRDAGALAYGNPHFLSDLAAGIVPVEVEEAIRWYLKPDGKAAVKRFQSFTDFRRLAWLLHHRVFYDQALLTFLVCPNTKQFFDNLYDDPWSFMTAMDGIGFKTADQVATALMLHSDHPARVRAAVWFAVDQWCRRQGHLFMLRSDLVPDVIYDIVGIWMNYEVLADGIDHMVEKGKLILDTIGGSTVVYSRALHESESGLARDIRRLMAGGDNELNSITTEEVDHAIEESRTVEDDIQVGIVRDMLANNVMVITGGPGTGKTTIIKLIERTYSRWAKIGFCSPTGKASSRMNEMLDNKTACTIHRFLCGTPARNFRYHRGNQLQYDIVIVDEFSMVDAVLASDLLAALANGTKLVMVGDKDQLPSVGPGQVLEDMIVSNKVPTYMLTKIYRQKEGSITQCCQDIAQGRAPSLNFASDADVVLIETNSIEETASTSADITRRLMSERGPLNVQMLTPMHRNELGTLRMNELIRNTTVTMRQGDKVMQKRNNYDDNVFNGELGLLEYVDDKKVIVLFGDPLDPDAKRVEYGAGQAQINLMMAYATTVHKFQGSEVPVVVMPLDSDEQNFMLRRNLIYTAFSRAKERLYLVGDRHAVAHAVDNAHADVRNTWLAQRIHREVV